jgi:hypothetical protein
VTDETLHLRSTLTCPACGTRTTEIMPLDACQYFYECSACGALLKPRPGDCCVFCSYGDAPCPPIQQARAARLSPSRCGCHGDCREGANGAPSAGES